MLSRVNCMAEVHVIGNFVVTNGLSLVSIQNLLYLDKHDVT